MTSVEARPAMRLEVTFVDGTAGEVRMKEFLEGETVTGTVFEPLRNPQLFGQVHVVLGAVGWPTGADLAPDAMYDAIRAHGYWTVEASQPSS